MVKITAATDIICITDSELEDNFILTTLLSNPENETVAKDVAQKIQKFYFSDKSNSAAVLSSSEAVRNNFLFCSYSMKFSMSFQLGSLRVNAKTEINGT